MSDTGTFDVCIVCALDEEARAVIEVFSEQSTKREGMDLASAALRALGAIGARGGTDAVDKQQAGEVRRFLLRAVGNPDFRVRLAAAEVAAQQVPLDINMRGALRQLLGDESPVVRQATAEGIGKAKIEELIPESQSNGFSDFATLGALGGFAVMMALDVALG